MYAYISGKLEGVAEDAVIIDNHGIGYQILVPSSTLDRLPSVGGEVKVYTYLQVREDAMVLFGFLTKEELELFKRLITVTGIGPKGALAILGTLSVDDLRFAILSGDAKAFEGRLASHGGGEDKSALAGVKNEAVMALTALGYTSSDVLSAMAQMDIPEDISVEELLKQTLKQMAFL